jgi:hypothetical protein
VSAFDFLPERGKGLQQMDDFEQFWRAYPRKAAKGIARKAWEQTAGIRPPLPELLETIEAHKKQQQWLKDSGEFIPYPASWLRAERWADELEIDFGANKNGKLWHESWSGIVAKGKELGIPDSSDAVAYRASVMRAAMKAA